MPFLRAFLWMYGSVFDIRHRVSTTRRIASSTDRDGQGYEAICGWHLRAALPPGSVTEADVFADVGSGKGRGVLLAASRYPFASVIGVERDHELHLRAQGNLRTWKGPRLCAVELIEADALNWQIPREVSVVLLFNPFVGSTFEEFIGRLTAALRESPRRFRLVYFNARMHQVVVAAGFTFVGRFGRVSVYSW